MFQTRGNTPIYRQKYAFCIQYNTIHYTQNVVFKILVFLNLRHTHFNFSSDNPKPLLSFPSTANFFCAYKLCHYLVSLRKPMAAKLCANSSNFVTRDARIFSKHHPSDVFEAMLQCSPKLPLWQCEITWAVIHHPVRIDSGTNLHAPVLGQNRIVSYWRGFRSFHGDCLLAGHDTTVCRPSSSPVLNRRW